MQSRTEDEYEEDLCEHDEYEDCMVCKECGHCRESLNDDDLCAECVYELAEE